MEDTAIRRKDDARTKASMLHSFVGAYKPYANQCKAHFVANNSDTGMEAHQCKALG